MNLFKEYTAEEIITMIEECDKQENQNDEK